MSDRMQVDSIEMTSQRRYIAPLDSKLVTGLTKLAWPLVMRLKHGHVRMKIVGNGLGRFKKLKNKRVVICPNHSTAADAEVIFGLSRLVKEDFHYMTAHELFHGNHGWNRLILPRLGCYSVTRGAGDISAYKLTRDLLVENKRKVVVFPEGEVSHLNDVVMPLESGVVHISFSALNKLDTRESIFILPVAIKYFFDENVSAQLDNALCEIEHELGLPEPFNVPRARRARCVLMEFIQRLEHKYAVELETDQDFNARINRLRWTILKRTAKELDLDVSDCESQIEYAHTVTSALFDLDLHNEVDIAHEMKEKLRELERDVLSAIHLIAVDVHVMQKEESEVTQEETAGLIEIVECALLKKDTIRCAKLILFEIGEPIDLRAYQKQYKLDKENTATLIEETIRTQLLNMLAHLDDVHQAEVRRQT